MAVGIGAVEFADRTKRVVAMLVCDECEALRSAGAVIAEVEVRYGADFFEEVLIRVSLPSRVETSEAGGEGGVTSNSDSVRS